MKKFFTLSFLLACLSGVGQNLVPNPSFEDTINCPDNIGEVDSCMSWHPVRATPDFFSPCAPFNASVPDNIMGYQAPFEGNNYMGLITFNGMTFEREIIGAELLDSLEIGKSYNISMRVSKGNYTFGSYNTGITNKLGVRFSTSYSSITPPAINNSATVYCDSMIADTANWILLSWNYVADSAYKYIAIGNFFDDDHTDTVNVHAFNGGRAYYFIDDVCVSTDSLNCNSPTRIQEPKQNTEISLFPNPFTNQLSFEVSANEPVTVTLYDIFSRQVMQKTFTNSATLNTEALAKGIYIYVLRNSKGIIKKGKVVRQ